MSAAERLAEALTALDDVVSGRSRFAPDHPAWTVEGREFAHLHDDDHLDLRLPADEQARWRDDPRVVARASPSPWMEFRFGDGDVDAMIVLARIARDGNR